MVTTVQSSQGAVTLTRGDRALTNLALLTTNKVWRTIAGVALGWILTCTLVAGFVYWQMMAHYGPSVWSKLPPHSAERMMMRYTWTTFLFPGVILFSTLLGTIGAGLLRAPRSPERTVSIDDTGVSLGYGKRSVILPWTAITGLRQTLGLIILRAGAENATIIPMRAFGSAQAGRQAYDGMRQRWELRRHETETDYRDPMVSYFLTATQGHQAGRNHLGLTGRMRPWALWTAFGLVLATLSAGTWAVFDYTGSAPLVAFGLAGVTGLFAKRQDPAYRFANRMCAAQGDYSPTTVRLTPEAVHETTALSERRVPWDQVKEISDGKTFVVIKTGDEDAIVIPRTAFPTPRAADVFARTAEMHLSAATGAPDAIWPPPAATT